MSEATIKAAEKAAAEVQETTTKAAEDFTAAAQDQFRQMIDAFTGNSEELREQGAAVADEMRARFEKTQQQVADVNANFVAAAQTEFTEAVQFANDLASAKTFADALSVQQNYWSNLFNTRVERTRELTENSLTVVRETMTPIGGSMTEMFDPSKMFAKVYPAKA